MEKKNIIILVVTVSVICSVVVSFGMNTIIFNRHIYNFDKVPISTKLTEDNLQENNMSELNSEAESTIDATSIEDVASTKDTIVTIPIEDKPIYNGMSVFQGEYNLLWNFVMNKMNGKSGVYTNYLETDIEKEDATGHDVLSESQGLSMDIGLSVKNMELFKNSYAFVEQNMLMENAIAYRYDQNTKKHEINAAVDDLRIIGALIKSKEVFDTKSYFEKGIEYSKDFLTTNVQNGYIVDYYDPQYPESCDFTTLCYVDFTTLKDLSNSNKEYNDVYKTMMSVVSSGYISDELPLYETRYNYTEMVYETSRINMIECVLTMIHLAEVNQLKQSSLNYIKSLVEQGVVYSVYETNGNPKGDEESTAVYGLCALLGYAVGDSELYNDSINLMMQFQVLETNSEVYGGFANGDTLEAYSFDNLLALLALSKG